MKQLRVVLLALAAVAALMMVGCNSPEKMLEKASEIKADLNPNPLVLVGDSVQGSITGTFPPKYFHKKAMLELVPVIVYDGGELKLPSKTYQGEDVTENNDVISNANGGRCKVDFKFKYEPQMMRSTVELRFVLHYKGKTSTLPAGMKVGIGINETQNLALLEGDKGIPTPLAHNYVRDRQELKDAQINFAIQQATLRPGELTKDDVKELLDQIKQLSNDQKQVLTSLDINAYASPDGPVALNDNLSKGRGKVTQDWLMNNLRKNKIRTDVVKIQEQATDWDGFKKLVENSNIEDKELILRVLSMYSDPDVRNREMHNMGKVFQVLAEDILPKLRRAQMVANVQVQGRTDEETKALVDAGKIGELPENEALYAVTLYDDADKKAELYRAITAADDQSYRAYNNLACILLNKNDLSGAKSALDKAAAIEPNNSAILNNQGVVAVREGRYDDAEKLYVKATDAGEQVRQNLGFVAILKGDYKAAVEYLKGSNSFNQGLALLLTDNLTAAQNTFNDVKKDEPLAYYGLAIIGARNEDEKMAVDNLREAISMRSDLKERAKKDVEFRKLAQSEMFANLLK